MTDPNDLTGRDLDLAVARALGWTDLRYETLPVYRSGVTGGGVYAPTAESLVGNPPDGSSPRPMIRHVPRYSEDGGRIPELFAEIRKRTNDCVDLTLSGTAYLAASGDHQVHASTPSEALAQLLMMVAQR